MRMRLRIPELLAEHGLTPYALSKRSDGRISMSTAYRLRESRGQLDTYSGELLEALCDVFGVGPGELLERSHDGKRSRRARRAP